MKNKNEQSLFLLKINNLKIITFFDLKLFKKKKNKYKEKTKNFKFNIKKKMDNETFGLTSIDFSHRLKKPSLIGKSSHD